jgi:hypothetical protein
MAENQEIGGTSCSSQIELFYLDIWVQDTNKATVANL